MSTNSRYDHQGPYDAGYDDFDEDEDLELALDELDPATTHGNGYGFGQRSNRDGQSSQGRGRHIPLRQLRTDGLGRLGRRKEDYGDGAEDARGLLEDEEGETSVDGLLASNGRPRHSDSFRRGPATPQATTRRWIRNPFSSASRIDAYDLRSPAVASVLSRGREQKERVVGVNQRPTQPFPPNLVSNAKYTPWSFLPRTLYNEFSFFFNLYFLLVALSQIIPQLRIGYLSTYIAPLAFVLSITLGKEALDDIARRRRDAEANSEPYTVLQFDQLGVGEDFTSKRRKKAAGRKKSRRSGASSEDNARIRLTSEDSQDGAAAGRSSTTVREARKRASDLRVGDVIKLEKNQRVPADIVILQTLASETAVEVQAPDENQGSSSAPEQPVVEKAAASDVEAFIRTDQLDGETDWKLRIASPLTQNLDVSQLPQVRITGDKPSRDVNEFIGFAEISSFDADDADASASDPAAASSQPRRVGLSIDNTAWANTVLASSCNVLGLVLYTGPETRAALSTSQSRSKTGKLEYEINSLTKILCILTLLLSVLLVGLGTLEENASSGNAGPQPGPQPKWYVSVLKFLILFSTIVPISLRVNLDMGKTVYAWFIERDKGIPGTVVRTSTIPEDLGRIEYLLSDKTGTLTQNEMDLKKIHVGTVSYANEAMDEVSSYIHQAFTVALSSSDSKQQHYFQPAAAVSNTSTSATRQRREIGSRVRDLVLALALCHNVTPTTEEIDGELITTYQASSPDEIAIVRWVESVGLRLLHRDRKSLTLQSVETSNVVAKVEILNIFPFTSESKRMGVVLQFQHAEQDLLSTGDDAGEIWFFQKGADTVMTTIVQANDWLDEETANMAREGLRTLVVGRKQLSAQEYQEFNERYKDAAAALQDRDATMATVVKDYLEQNLELLGVTGVEDKLQRDVKPSLELLRNAGIKIWMLTGDKVETARCVAVSAKLVARGQYIHTVSKVKDSNRAREALDVLQGKPDACLLIDGDSLSLMLTHHRSAFIRIAVRLPAVVACRCSPTQKADVAKLIRAYTKKRVCCIGDGGNDVSMIQAADIGVGIVGKEGRQASLAADFSITQFCHLTKLLVWHGRNSYKRSAKLAQFVIHRGLIISVAQTVYSIATRSHPNVLYRDWLLVGYATVYTMMPVFSLVLDRDVDEELVNLYPELYKELALNRSLSYKTFFVWCGISLYQGCIIQGGSQIFVGLKPFNKMVAVSFTALVLNELLMVAAEITTWHPVMIFSILATAGIYAGSVPFLGDYFDLSFIVTVGFVWRLALITSVSLIPPYIFKVIRRTLKPPSYRKVQRV